MAGEPVLVVDDNATNLKLIRVLLRGAGYEVHTAGDAEEALRVLESAKPRLILMDVQLPGISGLELTRRLKADERTRDLIVVALTAYAMKGDEEKALAAGCDAYVSKPIDADALLVLVTDLLAGKRPQGAPRAPEPPEPARASDSDDLQRRLARMLGDVRHDLGNLLNPLSIHLQIVERALGSGDLNAARESVAECKMLLRRGKETVDRLRVESLAEEHENRAEAKPVRDPER